MTMYPYQNTALINKHNERLCKCAECGAKATLTFYYLTDIPRVRCTSCKNDTGLCNTPEEAVEKWNEANSI